MLAGTKALIERTLELDTALQSKTAARTLSQTPAPLNSLALIKALYSLIEMNHDGSTNRGEELWRWTVRPHLTARNPSPEKTLEKAIVKDTAEWVNQIPAASGLLTGCDERHMNVDLARRCGPNWFEFVELKAGPFADTPLWAAFEILRYGMLYCFARAHRSRLYLPKAQVLMKAHHIDLKVLAPVEVYACYNFAWLAESLDRGLKEFSRQKFAGGLNLRFQFEAFPPGFRWPEHRPRLAEMLAARSPIYDPVPETPLFEASPLHRESA